MPMVMRVMPQSRLRTIGAEQAIPPGQIEAEIAVGFPPVYRMVHAVHVRRHDDEAQDAVERARQPHIAVVEQRGGVQQDFEDEHGERRRAEHGDGGELDRHGKKDFAGMEPQSSCHVEFQIGVMHAMQAPQQRHRVKAHMLAVDREIEQKHGGGYRKPGGQGEDVEETPSFAFGKEGHADASERKEQAHDERVEHHEAQIIRPAPEPADGLRAVAAPAPPTAPWRAGCRERTPGE